MGNISKIKVEAVPQYAEIDAIGVTVSVAGEAINGSKERRPFTGRRILTETAGFDAGSVDPNAPAMQIAKGDGSRLIQTVKKTESLQVFIKLGDGFKSRALELTNIHVCKDTKDNKGALIAYVHVADTVNSTVFRKITEFAPKMIAAHPDSFGDWELVDGNGDRVIVYSYDDVDSNGHVAG